MADRILRIEVVGDIARDSPRVANRRPPDPRRILTPVADGVENIAATRCQCLLHGRVPFSNSQYKIPYNGHVDVKESYRAELAAWVPA